MSEDEGTKQSRGRPLEAELLTQRELQALLVKEYFQLQKILEDFDSKALTIKAWSVTVSAAGVGAAYVEHASSMLLLSAGSAFVFWMVEALWKVNQQAFYRRLYQIENYFGGTAEAPAALQIGTNWSVAWREKHRSAFAFRIMRWPHVSLPHLAVAIVATALYFTAPPRRANSPGRIPLATIPLTGQISTKRSCAKPPRRVGPASPRTADGSLGTIPIPGAAQDEEQLTLSSPRRHKASAQSRPAWRF